MATIRFRPTFSLISNGIAADTIGYIRSAVENNSNEVIGQFKTQHAMISVVEFKRHFWSPWLNLDVQEHEVGCKIMGRFSPHPGIWTGFMFAYLILAVLIFFSLIAGMSLWLAGQSLFAFYLVPVWCLIAIVIWLASQMGQRLAQAEMEMIMQMVVDAVALSGETSLRQS